MGKLPMRKDGLRWREFSVDEDDTRFDVHDCREPNE